MACARWTPPPPPLPLLQGAEGFRVLRLDASQRTPEQVEAAAELMRAALAGFNWLRALHVRRGGGRGGASSPASSPSPPSTPFCRRLGLTAPPPPPRRLDGRRCPPTASSSSRSSSRT